ncbi:MAG: sulfite exporter TauE/SafE family protein [Bacteroidota bacterium]
MLICLVAFLYSSVGHGGASGYLAVLSLFAVAPAEMSTTALILNVLVAGMGTIAFVRAGHYSSRLLFPFLLPAVPAAFLGGALSIADDTYLILLAIVLLLAASRLIMNPLKAVPRPFTPLPVGIAVVVGTLIGMVSGMVGVGGGIFLSPLLMLFRWADPKSTAAVSAVFILVNSVAGLAGRVYRDALVVGNFWPLVIAAGIGGVAGAHLGAKRFPGEVLQKLLAVVLLVAALKLLITAGSP